LKVSDEFVEDPVVKDQILKNLPPADANLRSELLINTVQELDEFGAVANIEQLLTSVRALTYLAPQGLPCEWEPMMYVMRHRETSGLAIKREGLSFEALSRESGNIGRVLKGMGSYSQKIFSAFDEPSVERILSSTNTAALARTSSNLENQLISLWSAVEVLLTEPPRHTPRILHYAKLFVPCVCQRHVRRQMAAVYEQLLIGFGRDFRRLLREAKEPDNRLNFGAVLFLPEHELLRKRLLSLCESSPLALPDYGNCGATIIHQKMPAIRLKIISVESNGKCFESIERVISWFMQGFCRHISTRWS
jgi:hypothetical protein